MTSWDEFAAAAPELAAAGLALLERRGPAEGLLATVRDVVPPRIHTVKVGIVDGHLLTFVIVGSAKTRDLEEDGRYALHAHLDPEVPHEFLVRGRATTVANPAVRDAAVAAWPFEVDDGYELFDLSIDHALLGQRASAEDWPPVFTSWKPASGT